MARGAREKKMAAPNRWARHLTFGLTVARAVPHPEP